MAAHTTPVAPPQQRTASPATRGPARPLNHKPTAIREAREARGMTQAELGALIGRSHNYVSQIEGGDRDARPELLQSIATALGVDYVLLERPRDRAQCTRCDYRYEVTEDGHVPLHLADSGTFCAERELANAEAA